MIQQAIDDALNPSKFAASRTGVGRPLVEFLYVTIASFIANKSMRNMRKESWPWDVRWDQNTKPHDSFHVAKE